MEDVNVKELFLTMEKPIHKRHTEYTDQLTTLYEELVKSQPVKHIDIEVGIKMNTPFPSLGSAKKSVQVPMVDPHSLLHLAMESIPELEGNELFENTEIIFEKQAMKVIEAATYAFLKCAVLQLQEYFPRTSDFEKAFNKALNQIEPIIDSVNFDENRKQAQSILSPNEEFESIIANLFEEE